MGELGDYAAESHRQVGIWAKAAGIERLFATGTEAQLAVETFGAGASWFADTDDARRGLSAELSAAPDCRRRGAHAGQGIALQPSGTVVALAAAPTLRQQGA